MGIEVEERETRNHEWPNAAVTMIDWDLGIASEQPLPIEVVLKRSAKGASSRRKSVANDINRNRINRAIGRYRHVPCCYNCLVAAVFYDVSHCCRTVRPKSVERVSEAIQPAKVGVSTFLRRKAATEMAKQFTRSRKVFYKRYDRCSRLTEATPFAAQQPSSPMSIPVEGI